MERFTNKFEAKCNLYKLHGSVDFYIYNFQNREYQTVRLPRGADIIGLYKEYHQGDGSLAYDNCWWNYFPDFLSGTTEKILKYEEEHYYKLIFRRFEENLSTSTHLFVIGYGFGDRKINEFIETNFLSREGAEMLIVDIRRPDTEFLNRPNVKLIEKGVAGVELSDFKKLYGFDFNS